MPSRRKHVFRRRSTLRQRNKQTGGGKRSLLPFDGTPKLGEPFPTEYFHIKRIKDDIKENWEYYMVSGHGATIPTEYSKVPDETYIIFNAPAGCDAFAHVIPFEETTVAPTDDMFYENMYRAHKRAVERLHAVTTKKPIPGGDGEFLLRTLAPSERTGLKSCPYPPEFYKSAASRNTKSLSTIGTVCDRRTAYVAKTIYGPGESYPKMEILFQTDYHFNIFLLGLYKLPISPKTEENLLKLSKGIQKDLKSVLDKYTSDPVAGLTPEEKKVMKESAQQMDTWLFGKKGIYGDKNYAADLIGRMVTLEDVLKFLPKLPPTKSRFVFVTSCRGLFDNPDMPNTEAARIASLMRQASVETENTEIARLKGNVTKAAGTYYAPAAPVTATPVTATPVPAALAAGAAVATGGAGTGTTL